MTSPELSTGALLPDGPEHCGGDPGHLPFRSAATARPPTRHRSSTHRVPAVADGPAVPTAAPAIRPSWLRTLPQSESQHREALRAFGSRQGYQPLQLVSVLQPLRRVREPSSLAHGPCSRTHQRSLRSPFANTTPFGASRDLHPVFVARRCSRCAQRWSASSRPCDRRAGQRAKRHAWAAMEARAPAARLPQAPLAPLTRSLRRPRPAFAGWLRGPQSWRLVGR